MGNRRRDFGNDGILALRGIRNDTENTLSFMHGHSCRTRATPNGSTMMTFPTLDRPRVRSHFVGWTIPCLLLFVACGDPPSPSPDPPLVEGEPLGTAGAHEHGIARLGLAVDGPVLTVDLELPAESVFGFEHAPRTEQERATAAEALDRLQTDAARLLTLPDGVTCALDSAEVEGPEDVEHDHAHEGQQAQEDEGDEHSDVHLVASLTCSGELIGPASLRFADLLPGVEQVDLTVVTAAGEAAGRVAPDASFRF